MDFVEYDGVGTVKPMPLALEHDADVEKDDKVKAPLDFLSFILYPTFKATPRDVARRRTT